MVKLTILFQHPPDVAEFEDRWARQFLPFAEAMPGVRRIAVSNVIGGPAGASDYYKVHEFYFDDQNSLDRALRSEKGVRAGQALMGFAADIATLLFSEVFEEARPTTPSGPTSADQFADPPGAESADAASGGTVAEGDGA